MDVKISYNARHLTFKLMNDELLRIEQSEIDIFIQTLNEKWISFSQDIQKEDSLTPYAFWQLRDKWLQGKATVVINGWGKIISFLSLNVFNLGEITKDKTEFSIYETATGWTNPLYRKKGINLFIRKELIKLYSTNNSVFMSFTRGIGASYLLKKLNWQVVEWEKYIFCSSFIGWFLDTASFYKVGYGEITETRKWNNVPLRSLNNIQPNLLYLWVDNLVALENIETILRAEFKEAYLLQEKILINERIV